MVHVIRSLGSLGERSSLSGPHATAQTYKRKSTPGFRFHYKSPRGGARAEAPGGRGDMD